jgi:hypothetical protein
MHTCTHTHTHTNTTHMHAYTSKAHKNELHINQQKASEPFAQSARAHARLGVGRARTYTNNRKCRNPVEIFHTAALPAPKLRNTFMYRQILQRNCGHVGCTRYIHVQTFPTPCILTRFEIVPVVEGTVSDQC